MVVALALVALLVFVPNAHAYMDPGSGSLILQAIIGALAAAIVSLRIYWGKIKEFFKGKSDKDK